MLERVRGSDLLLPERYTGVGIGLAFDDDPVALIAYAHDSPESASLNAEALREMLANGDRYDDGRPWSDLLTVDQIDAEGPLVTARLRLADDFSAGQLYEGVARDPVLFAHR